LYQLKTARNTQLKGKNRTTHAKRNLKKIMHKIRCWKNNLLELKVSNQLKTRTNPWLMIPHDVS